MSLGKHERVLHGQLIRPHVNHARVAHVSDFSNQKGGEEDVLGCQVSVDDCEDTSVLL